ncbi:RNA polymerase sigma factor [Paenibacillus sp. KS-LC4]|uniref:RNA polymerase sigma factor n=1 Tax=Paenibacillus sp. KS-LC4 TaxID=2979727 RepID=UPI0030D62BA6
MTERELFEQYNRDVYKTCYYMLRNAADAEDICQEVFVTAFRKEWRQVDQLKAWLLRLTVNSCLNAIRRAKNGRLKESLSGWLMRRHPETVEQVVEKREAHQEYSMLVEQLPLKFRTVIALRYMQEQTLPEIADILGIPVGTVKSRLHKGLKLMKQALEAKDGKYEQGGMHYETIRERNDSALEKS